MSEDEEIDLDVMQSHLDRARAELRDLCKGKRWLMTIPADRQNDSDLVIAAALKDLARLIKEVERAWKAIDDFESAGLDE